MKELSDKVEPGETRVIEFNPDPIDLDQKVSHPEWAVRTEDLVVKSVFVASESEIKGEAVSDGLGGAEVKMVVSESGIDKQPMGMEMIRTGVKNRMKSALKNGARGRVYAIENGLIKKKGKYFDVGMVLLLDTNTGNYAMALTEEIGVPINIVKTMIRRGVEKTTWGMVLAEKYPDRVDHQDPHHFITGGEYSRKILIKEAVQKVERILETHKR